MLFISFYLFYSLFWFYVFFPLFFFIYFIFWFFVAMWKYASKSFIFVKAWVETRVGLGFSSRLGLETRKAWVGHTLFFPPSDRRWLLDHGREVFFSSFFSSFSLWRTLTSGPRALWIFVHFLLVIFFCVADVDFWTTGVAGFLLIF